jgi:hypothetical protein
VVVPPVLVTLDVVTLVVFVPPVPPYDVVPIPPYPPYEVEPIPPYPPYDVEPIPPYDVPPIPVP